MAGRNDIFTCVDCGYHETRQELEDRVFNPGLCGKCGGKVVPAATLDQAEHRLHRAQESYRKLTGRRAPSVRPER